MYVVIYNQLFFKKFLTYWIFLSVKVYYVCSSDLMCDIMMMMLVKILCVSETNDISVKKL